MAKGLTTIQNETIYALAVQYAKALLGQPNRYLYGYALFEYVAQIIDEAVKKAKAKTLGKCIAEMEQLHKLTVYNPQATQGEIAVAKRAIELLEQYRIDKKSTVK